MLGFYSYPYNAPLLLVHEYFEPDLLDLDGYLKTQEANLHRLFFQKNWRNRGFLLAIVLGAMLLTHAILLAITYFMIQNKLHGLGYLRYPTQWLPVALPILAWVYAHKKTSSIK